MPSHNNPINPGSTIDITADPKQFINAVRQVRVYLQSLDRSIRSVSRTINSVPDLDEGFKDSRRSLDRFNNSVQRSNVFLGTFFGLIASRALQEFQERILGAGVALDALRARWLALNETLELGERSYQRIFDTSQELGVSFDAVLAGAVRLRNYGFESAQEIENLSRTIAVLSGGSAMAVERLVRALSQVVGSGRVAQEELNQFSEVIPIIRAIAEVTGIAEGRIRSLVAARDPLISPDVVVEALRLLEQGTYGRAALAQADTVAAAIERINNQLAELFRQLVSNYGEPFKNLLDDINNNFGRLSSELLSVLGIIGGAYGLGKVESCKMFLKVVLYQTCNKYLVVVSLKITDASSFKRWFYNILDTDTAR